MLVLFINNNNKYKQIYKFVLTMASCHIYISHTYTLTPANTYPLIHTNKIYTRVQTYTHLHMHAHSRIHIHTLTLTHIQQLTHTCIVCTQT